MSKRKDFEIFLYKNKLNTKTLLDISNKLSTKTIESLLYDLNKENQESQKSQENTLYIFTDGGCISNGKKNAKAAYSVLFTKDPDSPFFCFNKTKSLSNPSNNKAELYGIKVVFKTISENIDLFKKRNIIICTDSMYSIKCIETWSKNWEKNNWKNSKGEDVKNQDLIKEILEYKKNLDTLKSISVSFKHVFSHTKAPEDKSSLQYTIWEGNNIVDENIKNLLDQLN
jgi:ribonuclease HI